MLTDAKYDDNLDRTTLALVRRYPSIKGGRTRQQAQMMPMSTSRTLNWVSAPHPSHSIVLHLKIRKHNIGVGKGAQSAFVRGEEMRTDPTYPHKLRTAKFQVKSGFEMYCAVLAKRTTLAIHAL